MPFSEAEVPAPERGEIEGELSGGGEMGVMIRAFDWARTPIGAADGWPQSLRTAVSILLASGYPMYVAWGPQFVQFYNDAYRPILGATKHPAALGQGTRECFAEIWEIIGPMFERVMGRGQATSYHDFMLPLERFGYTEECYFDFSYSAIRDETGGVGGVFVTCSETTGRAVGERRLDTLRELAAAPDDTRTAEEACSDAARALTSNPLDVPFALVYLLDPDGAHARLVGSAGMEPGTPASPRSVAIAAPRLARGHPPDAEQGWPLAAVLRTALPAVVDDVTARFGAIVAGPWPEPVSKALALPITRPGAPRGEHVAGVLVAGVSPRRSLDAEYRGFLELIAGQVASAVLNARAYHEAVQRADVLAELDRAKTAFFSNVSHEFRTPLTLLLGPLEEVLASDSEAAAGTRPSLAQEGRERLEIAHRNSLRLLKLVNSLLDFSRLEAGRAQPVLEPTDLASMTAELARSFLPVIEKAGLRLEIDCPPTREPVSVDREMWERIVLNLLSNAFKFTFEGSITVALREAEAGFELTVADTGTGIPEADLPHLFERFHRVAGARSRTQEGTGIGLTLVMELTRLQGGSVDVRSRPGEGAAFTVRLPFASGAQPPAVRGPARDRSRLGAAPYVDEALRWLPDEEAAADEPRALAPEPDLSEVDHAPRAAPPATSRVLVIDDNADMRLYLKRLLAQHWLVETAADSAGALARARAAPPDLVLTDVTMPGLDGFGLLRALREGDATRSIPVVLVSARAGREAIVEGLAAGADDYLVKPFSGPELVARVKANLELSRMRLDTTRRSLEADQLRSAALRAADLERVKSDFLKLASHELRGPLAVLSGYLSMMADGSLGELGEQVGGVLPTLRAKADQMAMLVEQMLETARLEDRQLLLRTEMLDLRGLVGEALTTVAPQVGPGHGFDVSLPDRPVMAEVDRTRLLTVITNILDNAVKYSPDGGAIEVRCRELELGPVISITDHGIGIDGAQTDRLFTRFGRIVTPLNSHIQGTGLGLYLAREIMRMHGGDVDLESVAGGGTTVSLRLPRV
ncbi:MAG: ATP-binding protein [Candidatus Dormibacteraceae bacterium]